MAVFMKRWYRSRRSQLMIIIVLLTCIVCYTALMHQAVQTPPGNDVNMNRRSFAKLAGRNMRKPKHSERLQSKPEMLRIPDRKPVIHFIERRLREALKHDKGTGCDIPHLDPFDKEITQFDQDLPKVVCQGNDWVKCHRSECKVKQELLQTINNITCTFRDIIYETDQKYYIGPPKVVYGAAPYILSKSDHVTVKCIGRHNQSLKSSEWTGVAVGFRNAKLNPTLTGHEQTVNVLMFGFDSASRNGFIRRMPKSYKYLVGELKATILNRYNVVGDGTPAALFPILTGKTELELPDARKTTNNTLDIADFIFSKLKKYGYRTAYFEDNPKYGTFQYRFNGFREQPCDHYLVSFFYEEKKTKKNYYCVGDTPTYSLLMNVTHQFLNLEGKKFVFTLIGDISHDEFNLISTADEDTVEFLKAFKDSGKTKDTVLFFMGDHGPRFAKWRNTFPGKLEERLPLMAIRLPDDLVNQRPSALSSLQRNAEVLTTPHDIHATVLDLVKLTDHWNKYKVVGADLLRGLTLLQPIPKNRSCSEAGIEPHWCACTTWRNVSPADPLYTRAAKALVDYINQLTTSVRSKCVLRTLTSISWVVKQKPNDRMLSYIQARDADGYLGSFGSSVDVQFETYQVKITVGPGTAEFEASMTTTGKAYDKFYVDFRDISRTNIGRQDCRTPARNTGLLCKHHPKFTQAWQQSVKAFLQKGYRHEPNCIHLTLPQLNMFCYCRDQITSTES